MIVSGRLKAVFIPEYEDIDHIEHSPVAVVAVQKRIPAIPQERLIKIGPGDASEKRPFNLRAKAFRPKPLLDRNGKALLSAEGYLMGKPLFGRFS